MAVPHHLAHAPIREALLDIRVELPPEFSAVAFLELRDELASTYPNVSEGTRIAGNLQLDAHGKQISSDMADLGLHAVLFASADERTVAQFRTDGFTFNKLRPYTAWESIFPEAMRLWTRFAELASPIGVSRAGLRYINEFSLPGGIAGLGQFLRSAPTPSPAIGNVKRFLSQVVSEDNSTGQLSAVTYSVAENPEGSQTQVIFDIDVAATGALGIRVADLTPPFSRLHDVKNSVFFNSLTDDTIARFK